jgi:hypothetical protein
MLENRIVRGLLLSAFFALGSVACSNPCDELKDQCNDCPGDSTEAQLVEATCQAVVQQDDSDTCDTALDTLKCP